MSADILHHGHLNILELAKGKGHVIVGLLTDEAISSYKVPPLLPYEQRKAMLENISLVDEIVSQETLDYEPNLRKIKPDFVVHGDDWKTGPQKGTRDKVIDVLSDWGGELIEPKYTTGISSTLIKEAMEDGLKIDSKGTTTRRFEIRWNDGEVSEEWISYLEVYE